MIDYDAPLLALRCRDRIRPCHNQSTSASVPFFWESVPGQIRPQPSSSGDLPPPPTTSSNSSSVRHSSSPSSSVSSSAEHSPHKSTSASSVSRQLLIVHRFLPAARAVAANASPPSLRSARHAPACHGHIAAPSPRSSNSPPLHSASRSFVACDPVDPDGFAHSRQPSRHYDMLHPTCSQYTFYGRDMATWTPIRPSPCMFCRHDLATSMSLKPCPSFLSRSPPDQTPSQTWTPIGPSPCMLCGHVLPTSISSKTCPSFLCGQSPPDPTPSKTWTHNRPSPCMLCGHGLATSMSWKPCSSFLSRLPPDPTPSKTWMPFGPSPCMLCGHDLATYMSWKPCPSFLSRRPPDPTPSKPSSSPSCIYGSSQDDSTPFTPSLCKYPFPQEPKCDLGRTYSDDDDNDEKYELAPCLRVCGFSILPFHSSCFPLHASCPQMSRRRHKGSHLKSQHCLPIPWEGGLYIHLANIMRYVKVKTKNCVTCLQRMEPTNGLRQIKLSKTIFNLRQDKSKESVGNLQQNSDHRNLQDHIQTSENILKAYRVRNQEIIRSNERNKTEFGIDFPMKKHIQRDVMGPALPSSPAHSWLEKAIPLLPSRSSFASYMLNKEIDRITPS